MGTMPAQSWGFSISWRQRGQVVDSECGCGLLLSQHWIWWSTPPKMTPKSPKKGRTFNRTYIWTNHWFSGDMLVFGGVNLTTLPTYKYRWCEYFNTHRIHGMGVFTDHHFPLFMWPFFSSPIMYRYIHGSYGIGKYIFQPLIFRGHVSFRGVHTSVQFVFDGDNPTWKGNSLSQLPRNGTS